MTIDSDKMCQIIRERMLDKALLGEQVYVNRRGVDRPPLVRYLEGEISVYFPGQKLGGWTHPLRIIDLIDQGKAEFRREKRA